MPQANKLVQIVNGVPTSVPYDLFGVGRKIGAVQKAPGNGTTVGARGWGPPVATGAASSVRDNTGSWIQYTSGNVSGNVAGWLAGSFSSVRLNESPIFGAVVNLPATLTNYRIWIGLVSADPTASDDPAGLHLMGFRASTGVGDANFMRCTKDGATLNAISTGVSFSSGRREFVIDASAVTSIQFYIDGKSVGSTSSNLPSVTQDLDMVMQITTLTNATRDILLSHMWVSAT